MISEYVLSKGDHDIMISPWEFSSQAKCNLSIPCVLNEKIQCRDFALPLKAIKAVEQVTCPSKKLARTRDDTRL